MLIRMVDATSSIEKLAAFVGACITEVSSAW